MGFNTEISTKINTLNNIPFSSSTIFFVRLRISILNRVLIGMLKYRIFSKNFDITIKNGGAN